MLGIVFGWAFAPLVDSYDLHCLPKHPDPDVSLKIRMGHDWGSIQIRMGHA